MASELSGGSVRRPRRGGAKVTVWTALLLAGWLLLSACPGTPFAPPAATPTAVSKAILPTATPTSAVEAATRVAAWAVTPVVAGSTPNFNTPTPTATATAQPPRPTPSPADEILNRVMATRGLGLKQAVVSSFMPREQLRAFLAKEFEDKEAQESLARDRGIYVNLGLIQPKADLQKIWLDLLDEQIAGFYNLETKEMKLIGAPGMALGTGDELTLAHEYVHALQDQNYAAADVSKSLRGDQDRGIAYSALLEGDATLLQVVYATQYKTKEQLAQWQKEASAVDTAKYDAAPDIVRAGLIFPYEQGAVFVSNLYKSGGWAAVNKAFNNPPQSSEQLLHPEKYAAGEAPVKVGLPDLLPTLGAPWQALGTDTFGELGWQVYLSSKLAAKQAKDGAAGWGGDRYAVFENKGQYATVALTTWDSEAEARQFFQALRELYRWRTGQTSPADATRLTWSDSGGKGLAVWRGTAVLLVVSPDDATTQKLNQAVPGF